MVEITRLLEEAEEVNNLLICPSKYFPFMALRSH